MTHLNSYPRNDIVKPARKPLGLCLECMSRVCIHMVRPARLSPRHLDIIRLLMKGLSNKEIGSAAGLRCGTVRTYLSLIFDRLGLTSRVEVALWAVKHQELLEAA